MSGIAPHIEVTERLSFLNALQVVEGIGVFGSSHIVEVLSHILRVAEVDELVAHRCPHETDVVAEVFCIHGFEVQVELKTRVLHRSHVDECLVEEERRNAHFVVAQQVLLPTAEVVERTIQTVVKEREVDTHVPVLALLPAQVGVDVLRRSPHLEVPAVVEIVAETRHGVEREIGAEVLVAGDTVVGTQFQVVDPRETFHEGFRRDAPSGRHGGEVTPFVVGTELRRALVAQRCGEEVAAVIVVADACEEGYQLCIVLVAAHEHLALFLGILARAHVVGAQTVVGEVFVLHVEARIARVLVRIAGHALGIVLPDAARVVGEPLHHILALFRIAAAGLAFATVVHGNGAC